MLCCGTGAAGSHPTLLPAISKPQNQRSYLDHRWSPSRQASASATCYWFSSATTGGAGRVLHTQDVLWQASAAPRTMVYDVLQVCGKQPRVERVAHRAQAHDAVPAAPRASAAFTRAHGTRRAPVYDMVDEQSTGGAKRGGGCGTRPGVPPGAGRTRPPGGVLCSTPGCPRGRPPCWGTRCQPTCCAGGAGCELCAAFGARAPQHWQHPCGAISA